MSPISGELPELNIQPRRASGKSDMIDYFASGDFQAGILAQSRKYYTVNLPLCTVSNLLQYLSRKGQTIPVQNILIRRSHLKRLDLVRNYMT